MRHRLMLITFVVVLVNISFIVSGQSESTCPTIVATALEATNTLCDSTGRNQVCYGNLTVETVAQSETPVFDFYTPGDITDLSNIRQIHLNAMDETTGEWGVALMRVQANLPGSLPGQNINLLLFGEVQVTNAVSPTNTLEATVKTISANVRSGPSMSDTVISALASNYTVLLNGRNAEGDWLRFTLEDGIYGWVYSDLLDVSENINDLTIVEADEVFLRPMQAFYFRSGISDAPCTSAPESGILIQTPRGQMKVNLVVNGVNILLGSTVYLQAEPNNYMIVNVIEGVAIASAFGEEQTIPAGASTTIPISQELEASGPPSPPIAYALETINNLPLSNLPVPVTAATPWDPATFEVGSCVLTTRQPANLRSGPSVDYRIVASVPEEQELIPDGQQSGDDGLTWWRMGNAWIRTDLVETNQFCEYLPVVDLADPPPDIVSPSDTTSNFNKYQVYSCETTTGRPLRAGQTVLFFFGLGSRPTLREAEQAYGSQILTITLDGVPLNITYGEFTLGPGGYLRPASGAWAATVGTHIVQGSWSGGMSQACVVTIR